MHFIIPIVLFFYYGFAIAETAAGSEDSGSGGTSSNNSNGILSGILNYIKSIFQSITDFVDWLGKVFKSLVKSLWDLLTDLVFWLFESLFALAADLIKGIVQSFNLSSLSNTLNGYWDMVPLDVQTVMSAIGLPTALGIVITGILIRFGLQLIPFVRLGS